MDVLELYERFADGAFEYVPQSRYRTVKEAQDRIDDAETKWRTKPPSTRCIRKRAKRGPENWRADEVGLPAGATHRATRTDPAKVLLRARIFGGRATVPLDLAFDRLDLEVVTAGYSEGNEKSERAIEKYVDAHGEQYDGALRNWVPMDDRVDDLHRYTITREQYREHRE